MTERPADFDYSGYKDDEVGGNLLAQLSGLAAEQKEAEAAVVRAEEELKKAKARLRDVSEHKLPELMDEIGMEEFTTKDGIKIKVGEVIRASIPATTQAQAHAWLEENGRGAIIKRNFTIEFGKGEDAWAKKFQADLAKRKKPLRSTVKQAVHPQTLQAALRELLEDGADVPLDLFGAHRQRFTRIKLTD